MIPLTRPTVPKVRKLLPKLENVFHSGMLTNGKYVSLFEKQCAKFLEVKYITAVSSGTAGLMLAMKCLKLKGEVIMPSFTFTSTGHSAIWCGLTPVFADIDPKTFNIDPASIESKITQKTSAIAPVHCFGNPCEIEKIEKIAKKHKLKVIYDGAHAFGAKYKQKSVAGFGSACVFSLTTTKVLSAAEGGLIAANDPILDKMFKIGRNNGDSYNRSEEFLGLSARMSELNAILGSGALTAFKKHQLRRKALVQFYQKELKDVPGISFQKVHAFNLPTWKDFVILIDEKRFGAPRDQLMQWLKKHSIETKVYFYPALHQKKVYKKYRNIFLPNTDFVSSKIMNLPLYSHMPFFFVKKVCQVIKNFHCIGISIN